MSITAFLEIKVVMALKSDTKGPSKFRNENILAEKGNVSMFPWTHLSLIVLERLDMLHFKGVTCLFSQAILGDVFLHAFILIFLSFLIPKMLDHGK